MALIASLLVLPWTLLVFTGLLLAAWGTQYQKTPGIAVDPGLIAAIPAIAGLVFGVMRIVRGGVRTTVQQTWL